ncbi:MAG TPA: alpha/beta fold hydrolase [Puia sp.]|nr:alpha/beta fold hydrolase [Puia sp.]
MKTYLISGIGADYRLFTHIHLPDGYETRYIRWIDPQKGEPLPAYALRLAGQINTREPFVLIGFSLGGIMATEIAKIFNPVHTILISSIPRSSELPPYYIRAHRLRLAKLAAPPLMKFLAFIKALLTMRSRDDRKLMKDVIWSGDDRFISWAIEAVLRWENDTLPLSMTHIHGAWDEIFPMLYTHADYTIPKAGHNLTMTHPHSVNDLLEKILSPNASRWKPAS